MKANASERPQSKANNGARRPAWLFVRAPAIDLAVAALRRAALHRMACGSARLYTTLAQAPAARPTTGCPSVTQGLGLGLLRLLLPPLLLQARLPPPAL